MKTTLEATIPTTQYGNIRPVFELESEDEIDTAMDNLKYMWNRFGETPLKDKESEGVKVSSFTGEELYWNEKTHTYTDSSGNVLMSGSKYAELHSPKFDLAMMLPKTATSWEVSADDLGAVWKMNGDISTAYGNAIHNALELYHKYHKLGEIVQKKKELDSNYVLPKNHFLRKIVLEFIELAGTSALTEVLVSDVANKMAGTIDRLEVVDEKKKTCRIGDYKTNAELDSKKKLKYQKQLSFYAHILQNKGWTVEGLDLYYLSPDDGWVKETLEILPLE